MNTLSPEILNLILSELSASGTKLSQFAPVSKKWQELIEQRTFSGLHIYSTELAAFKDVVTSIQRRSILTKLELDVILPPFKDTDTPDNDGEDEGDEEEKDENGDDGKEEDKLQRNSLFTCSVQEFLETLKSWETEQPKLKNVNCLAVQLAVKIEGGNEWSYERQFDESLLHLNLNDEDELPCVERRVNFSTIATTPWKVEGASILRVAAAFRRLEEFGIELYDNEKRNLELRRKQRYDMAKQLEKVHTDSLKSVELSIFQSPTLNENFPIHNILQPSNLPVDHLSLSVHHLSLAPNLERLYINGFALISPSLFYSSSPTPNTNLIWPNLEWLQVQFDMKTPSGEWYFLPSSEAEEDTAVSEDDEEELSEDEMDDWEIQEHREKVRAREVGEYPINPTRHVPDGSKIYPLFRAVSHAAARMPKLRVLHVAMQFSDATRSYCEMWFAAPGVATWRDAQVVNEQQSLEEVRGQWRLFWNVVGLDTDEESLVIWRKAEAEKGRELVVYVLS